jgi:hypothetical protein
LKAKPLSAEELQILKDAFDAYVSWRIQAGRLKTFSWMTAADLIAGHG